MKAVGLSLDDLDLVVDPLQLTGVDGVVTVVEDSLAISLAASGRRPSEISA